MTSAASNDQVAYWNEEGGQRWTRHIDQVETMIEGFSSHLLAAVAARPGERILDVGCGGGVTSAAFAREVMPHGTVTGLDVSRVILDVARERYGAQSNLDFITADATDYAFTEAAYDVVTSRFGVMFFHDPVRAFTNLRRACRDHARLVFLCWRRLDENPWMALAANAAFTVVPPPPKPEPGAPGPFSLAKPERITSILSASGFTAPEIHAVDKPIDLGGVDAALDWLTQMGPAAQPLREAGASDRARARDAMAAALRSAAQADRVVLPGATWLVSARALA